MTLLLPDSPHGWRRGATEEEPPSVAALIPAGSELLGEGFAAQAPAGVLWDAWRTRRAHGEEVLERLLRSEVDAPKVGAVLLDSVGDWIYWLVSRGAAGELPAGVRRLSEGSWLTVATSARRPVRNAEWLYLPPRPMLSAPPWLATALRQRTCDYCQGVTEGAVVREDHADPTSRRVALDHGLCRIEFSAEMALWSLGPTGPVRPVAGWCDSCGAETERGRLVRETADRAGVPVAIARCLSCCQDQEQPALAVPLQSYAAEDITL